MNFKMSIVSPGSVRTMYLNIGSVYSDSLMTDQFSEETQKEIEEYFDTSEFGDKLETVDKAKRNIIFERIG
jgi:hypothetical protein